MPLAADKAVLRKKSIGGSDAPKIMAGEWLELWQVKTGRRSDEDLSDVLPVQMGHWTEPYNIAWFERKVGRVVNVPAETQFHPLLPFMHANLDGEVQLDEGMAVFQAKHVNAFVSLDDVAEQYYAQLQHEMEVTGYERAVLSVFFGNLRWEWKVVERDEVYVQKLLKAEREFWDHVKSGEAPDLNVGVQAHVDLSKLKTVKMHQNNAWVDAESIYTKTVDAAMQNAAALENIKQSLPDDVGFAYGATLCAVRQKSGRIDVREPLKTDKAKIERHQQKEAANG
jgi:predicted phage-related endonuclease